MRGHRLRSGLHCRETPRSQVNLPSLRFSKILLTILGSGLSVSLLVLEAVICQWDAAKKTVTKEKTRARITGMKCPKCFNPLRRVASTEDSVWFTCPLGHRFHSETGSGISDSEGHRYAVSE